MRINLEAANQEGLNRINNAQPFLVDVKYAKDVLPGMTKNTIGYAGPPINWKEMCGPLRGAIIGAIKYECLANTNEEAEALVENGKIQFVSNHSMGAVGPMTGIITYSMPLFEVKNETFGNYGYCTINEGLGKVMRFGANSDEVIERLKWIENSLAPVLKKAIALSKPINLKVIIAQALTMGDEMHQRNIAASSLFARVIMKYIVQVVDDKKELEKITAFITGNDQFFLNIAMAVGKATMDPVKNIKDCTLVTAMSRNGTNFGIKVSGLGETWFQAPVLMPKGLFFPGFTAEDANPDMGDSSIIETFGIGGFAMGSAPAVVRFVGAETVQDAINYTRDMFEITVGKSTHYQMPNLNFEGAPTGIDIKKVIETGILPVINTGMAHKEPGVGQVGAGIVHAPMDCFIQALMEFSNTIE